MNQNKKYLNNRIYNKMYIKKFKSKINKFLFSMVFVFILHNIQYYWKSSIYLNDYNRDYDPQSAIDANY